jgi:hypothetical protein
MSNGILRKLTAVYAAPKHAESYRDLNERIARAGGRVVGPAYSRGQGFSWMDRGRNLPTMLAPAF